MSETTNHGPDPEPVRLTAAPKVYLVGRQRIDDRVMGELLADLGAGGFRFMGGAGDAEYLVEAAGRLCYLSFGRPRPGGNAAYTRHVLEAGHGSVLEHAVYNLVITGVSRSFTHELVRHRAGFGFSQLSQRFHDESEGLFVVPEALAREVEAYRHRARLSAREPGDFPDEASYLAWAAGVDAADPARWDRLPADVFHAMADVGQLWSETVTNCQAAYAVLAEYLGGKLRGEADPTLRRKRAREAARSVLPNATESKVFVTANARALRHFIEMRSDPAADAEIRGVALAVLDLLRAESPNLFGDYAVTDGPGGPAAETPYRKV